MHMKSDLAAEKKICGGVYPKAFRQFAAIHIENQQFQALSLIENKKMVSGVTAETVSSIIEAGDFTSP